MWSLHVPNEIMAHLNRKHSCIRIFYRFLSAGISLDARSPSTHDGLSEIRYFRSQEDLLFPAHFRHNDIGSYYIGSQTLLMGRRGSRRSYLSKLCARESAVDHEGRMGR